MNTQDAREYREHKLTEERDRAKIAIDRHMQALEQFGAQRVLDDLATVADSLDMARLFGIVADLGEAKRNYDRIHNQLKRL